MLNVSRFNKIESPCWSAAHIAEMREALNKSAKSQGKDPRDVMIELSLHELNILVNAYS